MTKKILLSLFLFALFSIGVNVFWFYSGREFSPKNLDPPVQVLHETIPCQFPSGPYTYLGHGKQSMVFESADQSHVLKLFYWKRPLRKTWYRKPENWARFASPMWIVKTIKKRGEMKKLFIRYLWGFEDLRDDIALVLVHFSHTKEPLPLTLIDRKGKPHDLDLAQFPFVLQKKIELIPSYLNTKLDTGDIAGAKMAINRLREYFIKRIQMGYIDNPLVFEKKYGYLDDRPIQIDVGRFEKHPSSNLQKEEEKILGNLDRYLRKHYPIML